VQSLVDLSVNEVSVHFTAHTHFYADGPYSSCQQSVSNCSFEFYQSLKELPPDLLSALLKEDLRLVEQVFLPGCAREVERLSLYFELEAWRTFFGQRYAKFTPQSSPFIIPDDLAFALTNSPFGQAMFRLRPFANATQKIRQFIEHLNAVSPRYLAMIHHYNDSEIRQEAIKRRQLQDTEIEEFNRELSLSLDQSHEERMLLSLWHDLSPAQLDHIIKDLQAEE
jgi:hypothetical protein